MSASVVKLPSPRLRSVCLSASHSEYFCNWAKASLSAFTQSRHTWPFLSRLSILIYISQLPPSVHFLSFTLPPLFFSHFLYFLLTWPPRTLASNPGVDVGVCVPYRPLRWQSSWQAEEKNLIPKSLNLQANVEEMKSKLLQFPYPCYLSSVTGHLLFLVSGRFFFNIKNRTQEDPAIELRK